MPQLVRTLDEFVPPRSELYIYAPQPAAEREAALEAGDAGPAVLRNVRVRHATGELTSRQGVDALPLESFKSVVILAATGGEGSSAEPVAIDSRTLAALLVLRDVQTQHAKEGRHAVGRIGSGALLSESPDKAVARASSAADGGGRSWLGDFKLLRDSECDVVAEVLDLRTRHLISETQIAEYVLSTELLARAMAQVAEDRMVGAILSELLASDGQELYLLPLSDYLGAAGAAEALSFYDLSARARGRREVLLGWKLEGMPRAVLNPPDKAARRSGWAAADLLIVIAAYDYQ